MDSKELEGKVSLVTGASRGLGQAIAIKLASMGAKVALNYSASHERAKSVAEQIERNGGEAMLVKADVADANAVKVMIKDIVANWGQIDILVNNAGIRMSDAAWDEVINTNLRGAYLCSKYALRSMMDQPSGRIINISSLAGVIGNAGQSNYSASKGGLIAFTKSLARETGPRNITVNAIAPGFIISEMTDSLPQDIKDTILSRIPLGRFGVPEDIAELAAFLASERASYITAQVICIDGGVI
jgi:3-oxoacyl-[acyl-carrier protein] reductase